jgi:hypothetical protein
MERALTHDEALDAIVGALGVTAMSYQDAIESYLMLRRATCLFTSEANMTDETALNAAVERDQ